MPPYSRPSLSALPRAGTATKWLCGLLVGLSVLAKLTERKYGWGTDLLVFHADAVVHLEIWRLFTYFFIKSTPFGLLLSTIVLYLFGSWFESSWGSRDYVRFVLLASVGAAVLAIPLSLLMNTIGPFQDLGMAEGPDASVDAMMVALALNAPDSNILFGFVLPVRAKNLIFILLGIDVISGIMTGASTLSITLGGMAMGYVLITGTWRPRRLLDRFRVWRYRRRRRDGLYVVPPRDKHRLN